MATFDQLAADQRAIIEIVLKQGRSYEQIGEMLDLPTARVRELARDALAELAPFTAEFVDSEWRGQLADYVLRQQTGPEAQATRGHLRRSEPARIWTYSLLDALDDFYGDGDRPEIPLGEAGPTLRSRSRAAEEATANGEAPATATTRGGLRAATGGALSPAARSALLRRRIIGGLIAAVVIALLVFGGIELFGGGGSSSKKNAAATTGTTATPASQGQAQGQGQIVAEAALAPIGGFKGRAVAAVYQNGKNYYMLVSAKLPKAPSGQKYVIWLYQSQKQLTPVASDVPDKNGNLQGLRPLPNGWQNYRFVDITLQPVSGKSVRHGRSVLRGPLVVPQPSGGTGTGSTSTGTGSTTTP